ncbi:MAG: choice-of-anchor L domain-containing protein [Pikeienuella sp.]
MATAAQLNIDTTATAIEMAENVFGPGVTVVTATYNGDDLSSGIFSGGDTTAVDITPSDTGVIFSTGHATDVTNASGDVNQSGSTSTNTTGVDGDSDFNDAAGQSTFDGAFLESTFIPNGDTLKFQFVFGSEEYPEFVFAGFNDSIGVWVNGVQVELAIGAGQTSVDAVNSVNNSNLFVDNQADGANTEMDGFTITLSMSAAVNIGVENTLKIGVADAGDAIYDSNLLIGTNMIQSSVVGVDDALATFQGDTNTFDLTSNDEHNGVGSLTITQINGEDIAIGETVTLATGEQITLNADGTVTTTATGTVGTNTFSYRVESDQGVTDTAFVTFNTQQQVTVVDDSTGVTTQGFKVLDVLANDSSVKEGALTITHIDGQAIVVDGTITLAGGEKVTLNADQTLTITADADASSNSFTYTMQDVEGQAETATVNIVASHVDGTAGNDFMRGGYVDAEGNKVDADDGNNDIIFGYGGNDKIIAGQGNDNVDGGDGDDFVRAGVGDDIITGGAGADFLDGGDGADTMVGGTGNDVYFIDQIGDSISEVGGGGHDKVKSEISLTLGADFEDLWLINGAGEIDATGNASANMLVGNESDNVIAGLDGDDRLHGEAGDDVISGGAGADKIKAGDGADTVTGGDDNDKLYGEAGADSLSGGSGNDILFGSTGADTLDGGDGGDLLKGGSGADQMTGGAGDDHYYVDHVSDVVTELSGEGKDRVTSTIDDYTLADNAEILRLKGGDLNGTGNAGDNIIGGTTGANELSGGDGDDRLFGKDGDDILDGGLGADKLKGGTGADVLTGGAGDDKLSGGNGNDVLTGGTGDDKIYVGLGVDTVNFTLGDGDDVIKEFALGEDVLQITGYDFADLTFAEHKNGTMINMASGDSIFLAGVGFSAPTESDFVFV